MNTRSLTAATLDRYLQAIGQPQIFGAQYRETGSGWTQEPFDRQLVPDVLRRVHCVAVLADQARNLAAIAGGREPPAPDGCRP